MDRSLLYSTNQLTHSYFRQSFSHPLTTQSSPLPSFFILPFCRHYSEVDDFQPKGCFRLNVSKRWNPLYFLILLFRRLLIFSVLSRPTQTMSFKEQQNSHSFNFLSFHFRHAITRNPHILKNVPKTSSIFSTNTLVCSWHTKNMRKSLFHSNLPQE